MALGAVEVVTLRTICTRYLEKHVFPVLLELQQSQEGINTQLASLKAAVAQRAEDGSVDSSRSGSSKGAKSAGGPELAALEKQMKELREKFDAKADAKSVATKGQFLDLVAKVGAITSGGHATEVEAKAEAEAEAKRMQLERKVAELERKTRDLSSKLQLKLDLQDIPLQLDELTAVVQQKANARELQKLAATVERKANTSKVPTLAQLEKLEAAVAGKIDAHLCPTVHQVDELVSEMKRKASSDEVVSRKQFNTLSNEVKRKADGDDVVTSSSVEEVVAQKLSDVVASKADASEVPTLAQHRELATVTERKLAFLASKVQQQEAREDQWSRCQPTMPTIWCVPQVVEGAM